MRQYLPYLYMLFFLSLPFQLFKNYCYWDYAQQHGGYFAIYLNFAAMAASVPPAVRVVSLITLPVFVTIFVFETRKKFIVLATFLYFATALLILIMGSRLFVFALILTLWYVARIKSARKSRILVLLSVALTLAVVAQLIANYREDSESPAANQVNLANFLALEGVSLDVTSTAIAYRQKFSRYYSSYLWYELQDAFVSNDVRNYAPGKSLDYDESVLLSKDMFAAGFGVGSSFIGEAYVIGGLAGVVTISLLLGAGLHLAYRYSNQMRSLLVVALVMPVVLYMPRGNLLGWLSMLVRSGILLLGLGLGWLVYSSLISIRKGEANSEILLDTRS